MLEVGRTLADKINGIGLLSDEIYLTTALYPGHFFLVSTNMQKQAFNSISNNVQND